MEAKTKAKSTKLRRGGRLGSHVCQSGQMSPAGIDDGVLGRPRRGVSAGWLNGPSVRHYPREMESRTGTCLSCRRRRATSPSELRQYTVGCGWLEWPVSLHYGQGLNGHQAGAECVARGRAAAQREKGPSQLAWPGCRSRGSRAAFCPRANGDQRHKAQTRC